MREAAQTQEAAPPLPSMRASPVSESNVARDSPRPSREAERRGSVSFGEGRSQGEKLMKCNWDGIAIGDVKSNKGQSI